jgi:hypothetical protein
MVSNMIPATTHSQQQSYIFVDSELYEDGLYYYWLQNADFDGSSAFPRSNNVQYSTGGGNNGSPTFRSPTRLKPPIPIPSIPLPAFPMTWPKTLT